MKILRILPLLAVLFVGCEEPPAKKQRPIIVPPCPTCPSEERPIMNLPVEMREKNYSGGSCVHASNISLLRWQGHYELAEWWRQAYANGEYSDRLERRLDAAGLKYASTTTGDVEFLEWCFRTRRGAGMFFYENHSVNLVHLDAQKAGIMDNNRTGEIIWMDRGEFIRRWRGYGGYAWTLIYSPPPPLPPVS